MLPCPHARNDCGLCREMDADVDIVEEALDPPSWNDRQARRFCQGCIGRWMATMAMTLRNTFNRMLGCLFHCLQNRQPYNETAAFSTRLNTTA